MIRLNITMDEETLKMLEEQCDLEKRSKSGHIRELIKKNSWHTRSDKKKGGER
jgi:predicted CopG family antitoxin